MRRARRIWRSPVPKYSINHTREQKADDMSKPAENLHKAAGQIPQLHFYIHISGYLGSTVTVFTKSGGVSGSGFTGVLASVTEEYLSLITIIGTVPGCPLRRLRSVAHIRTDKIAAFVHNNIGSRKPDYP